MDDYMEITNWRKSTSSTNAGNECVEVGWTSECVAYRDTKQAGMPSARRPTLVLSVAAAAAFSTVVKSGRADLA
jgi:hypothetical protein